MKSATESRLKRVEPPAECQAALDELRAYCEGVLTMNEARTLEAHLAGCAGCRAQLEACRRLYALMDKTLGARKLAPDFSARAERVLRATPEEVATPRAGRVHSSAPSAETGDAFAPVGAATDREIAVLAREPGSGVFERLGAAPWWGISVALHVLVICLLGLITMTIGAVRDEDAVVVLTSLDRRPVLPAAEEKIKAEARDILQTRHETPPTDPNATNTSNILVPPDILAMAELGDHFETINPDRPDTHSAFGNPDARMFHSVSGSADVEGGGGMGGNSLLDDLIGVGGASSPGSGGGWGGGNGTGVGIGNGSGHGSFGQRNGGGRKLMVMRHGGGKATESAVDKGLEWLARNQEADGHWDLKKHDCPEDPAPDVGGTGLALLAFLGAGHTEKIGKYKDNVRRAEDWLVAQQKDDGVIYSKFRGNGYCHAVAGLALAEAAAMGRNPKVKEAAQKAVDYSINIHQCGAEKGSDRSGWRYSKGSAPDTSVTGWFIMQLKSAKVAGLHVDPVGFQGAENWLNKVEVEKPKPGDPYSGGLFTYQEGGRPDASITSVGMLGRLFMGTKPDQLGGGSQLLMKHLPAPGTKTGEHPLYYWYYGTLVMFQVGGDEWKAWNEAMKKTLLDLQCKAGNDDGSWDPLGREGLRGGRVVCTALGVLSLEVYYRYLPLYRE